MTAPDDAILAPRAALAEPPPAGPAQRWTNRYAALGERFFTRLPAQALPDPVWVARSEPLAAALGFPPDWAERPDWRSLDVLAGGVPWRGADPFATVYSGHQFGVWAGQLGDGRALMLGEIETPRVRWHCSSRGSGLTPFSAWATAGAVLRSVGSASSSPSEAMHHTWAFDHARAGGRRLGR
jgi:uncharacterized protein YdiU (UPF0061 family)